ncbi:MAG: hypothetical protein KIT87_10430 [Anaerolineae bacterium]|nr:hypothetical protein [Anaerolineae bacterium]
MAEADRLPVYLVREVHNYGGFFGGDTVSLTASPLTAPNETVDLTIADNVFANLTDRHHVVEGLALALALDGAEVRQAQVVGARDRAVLRDALQRPPTSPADAARRRPLAYHCPACNLWFAGAPTGDGPYTCRVCGATL